MNISKIFLGGTCNNSSWRDQLIKKLDKINIKYFNPVIEGEWTFACQLIEEQQKDEQCDCHLYTLTPKMTGMYSVAEVVESVHGKDKVTIFCYIDEKDQLFNKHQIKSLEAIGRMIQKHKGFVCLSLDEVISTIKLINITGKKNVKI